MVLFSLFFFAAVPSILIWLALVKFPRIGRWSRIFVSGFIEGVLNSAYSVWEDGQQRFCCERHPVADWLREYWVSFASDAVAFALVGCITLLVIDFVLRRVRS
jgi:hypothetical protein